MRCDAENDIQMEVATAADDVTMWGGQLLAATRNNVITCDHTK